MRQYSVKNDIARRASAVNSDTCERAARFLSLLVKCLLSVVLLCLVTTAQAQVVLDTSLKQGFPLFARISLPRALREDRELLRVPSISEWRELGLTETEWLESLDLTPSVSDGRVYYLASLLPVETQVLDIYLIEESASAKVYHKFNVAKISDSTRVTYVRKTSEALGIEKRVDQADAVGKQTSPSTREYTVEARGKQREPSVGSKSRIKEDGLDTPQVDRPSEPVGVDAANNTVVVTDDLSKAIGEYLNKQRQRANATAVDSNFSDSTALPPMESNTSSDGLGQADVGDTASETAAPDQNLAKDLKKVEPRGKVQSQAVDVTNTNEPSYPQTSSTESSSLARTQVDLVTVFMVILLAWIIIISIIVMRNRKGSVNQAHLYKAEQDRRGDDVAAEGGSPSNAVTSHIPPNFQSNLQPDAQTGFGFTTKTDQVKETRSTLAHILIRAAEEADRAEAESKAGAMSLEQARISLQQQQILFDCATALQEVNYVSAGEHRQTVNPASATGNASQARATSNSQGSQEQAAESDGSGSSDPRHLRVPVSGRPVRAGANDNTVGQRQVPKRPTRPKLDGRQSQGSAAGQAPRRNVANDQSNDPAATPSADQAGNITDYSKFELGEQYALALVYLNMGEPDTARDLLRELTQTGNPREKAEALKVLKENFDD